MKYRAPDLQVAALLGPLAVLVLVTGSPSWAAPAREAPAGHAPAGHAPAGHAPAGQVDRLASSTLDSAASTSDPAAVRLLERAAKAPATTAYHGVQFVSAWSEHGATGLVVEVDHEPGVGTTVHTEGNAQVPAADTHLPADNREPSLVAGPAALTLIASNYSLSLAGVRSVAGRPTPVVEAWRPDARAPSGRFWVDEQTGIVLRREVYDRRGRTTRASAFIEFAAGEAPEHRRKPQPMSSPWSRDIAESALTTLRARGWHCPRHLPGGLTLVDARQAADAQRRNEGEVLHLSFSDGLSALSLFEQRGRLDTDNLEGYRPVTRSGRTVYVRDGIPTRVVWSARGMVYTIVADAPTATVDEAIAALPRPDSQDSRWGRLSRGMNRVASWFNPFA